MPAAPGWGCRSPCASPRSTAGPSAPATARTADSKSRLQFCANEPLTPRNVARRRKLHRGDAGDAGDDARRLFRQQHGAEAPRLGTLARDRFGRAVARRPDATRTVGLTEMF